MTIWLQVLMRRAVTVTALLRAVRPLLEGSKVAQSSGIVPGYFQLTRIVLAHAVSIGREGEGRDNRKGHRDDGEAVEPGRQMSDAEI